MTNLIFLVPSYDVSTHRWFPEAGHPQLCWELWAGHWGRRSLGEEPWTSGLHPCSGVSAISAETQPQKSVGSKWLLLHGHRSALQQLGYLGHHRGSLGTSPGTGNGTTPPARAVIPVRIEQSFGLADAFTTAVRPLAPATAKRVGNLLVNPKFLLTAKAKAQLCVCRESSAPQSWDVTHGLWEQCWWLRTASVQLHCSLQTGQAASSAQTSSSRQLCLEKQTLNFQSISSAAAREDWLP